MNIQSNFNSSRTLRALVLFISAIISTASFAQSLPTEVEIIQEAFGLEKKVAVANFMDLGEDAESFWVIYDEYEAERKVLGKERIEIIADYAQNYPTISDEKILELFKQRQQLLKSMEKLQKSYFKRMSKEVGISRAAQFWQFETYLNSIIQASIYSQIPFIGENISGN